MEGSNTADNLFGHFFFLQHELTFVRLRISEVFLFFFKDTTFDQYSAGKR